MTDTAIGNENLDDKVQIFWVVSDLKGPRPCLNPENDIYDSYADALAECENRGHGYVPLVMNPQNVIRDLVAENLRLKKENETLRNAVR